ncbi:MAG: cytochrome oxidase subunit III [Gemmatimonadetes bacterium]|nr:MAG: cytochrome oxidase subunit III [Gemmatimonadota bacterium]
MVPPPTAPPVAPPRSTTEPPAPQPSRTGVLIGIGTISMSFAALTSAMVVRQGAAPDWLHFQLPRILYLNTLVLFVSSGTLEWSRRRIAAGPRGSTSSVEGLAGLSGLYLTLALGLLFVTGQVVAWRQLAAQGLFLSTAPSSAFFYVLTALHGLHVMGGLGGLVYVLHRLRGKSGPVPHAALGAATLYWHFMDGLWLYLLVILVTRL